MPCHNCHSDFGILKKEVGCNICGFSFCTKCCSKKSVPSESCDVKKQIICKNCYENLTSLKPQVSFSPPLAHKKRMAALKKQSFSVDSGSNMPSDWSNEKDKEMAERLQRLKREGVKALLLPSEMEIEERLAKLKGMDPAKYNAPPIMVYRPAEKRSSIDQASDLMKQMKEELNLDSRLVKPEDEIAARLAHLKGQQISKMQVGEIGEPSASCNTERFNQSEGMDAETALTEFQKECKSAEGAASLEMKELNKNEDFKSLLESIQQKKELTEDDTVNDEEEANRLIEKLMATNIDDEMEDLESLNHTQSEEQVDKSSATAEEEEFPWCAICTEDAKMRCFGCDGDLYCMRCFKECHDSLDIKDHKTCPYFPPKDPLL